VCEKKLHPRTPTLLIEQAGKAENGRWRLAVLSLTDRCNIKCDFCCHPYLDSEISEKDAISLVAQASLLDFDEIAVTGGEPLIRKQLVLKLARICKENDKAFGLITNGFWAGNVRKARAWAAEFREAGVTRVTVSWDPSHGAFVSARTAQNALDSCIDEGLKVTLTGSFKINGDRHANYGIRTEHLAVYHNFRLNESHAAPAGNGAGVADINTDTDKRLADSHMRCPSQNLLELVFYARGGLTQPCCSIYAGYKMSALGLGDWRRHSVADLRDRQSGDPFFLILREHGFKRIYQIVRERDPELFRQLPTYGDALSVCHFCSKIMQPPIGHRIREVVNIHVEEKVASLIACLLQNECHAEELGSAVAPTA
jgi:MoaA/NifB/PqqE/SkfB family radical SAM enzyme